jgi:hypothetical protein
LGQLIPRLGQERLPIVVWCCGLAAQFVALGLGHLGTSAQFGDRLVLRGDGLLVPLGDVGADAVVEAGEVGHVARGGRLDRALDLGRRGDGITTAFATACLQ